MDSGFYDLINDLFSNGLTTDDIASQFTNTLNAINEDRRAKEEAARLASQRHNEMIADFQGLMGDIAYFLVTYDFIPEEDFEEYSNISAEDAEEFLNHLKDVINTFSDLEKYIESANLLDDKTLKAIEEIFDREEKNNLVPETRSQTIKTPDSTITIKQLTPEEAKNKAEEIQDDIKKMNDKINEKMSKFPKMHVHIPTEEEFLKALQKFLGNN